MIKTIDRLLDSVCPDTVYATTKHYSDSEVFGKEKASKLQSGQATVENITFVSTKGATQKAKIYVEKPETIYGNNWGSCFYTNLMKWSVKNRPTAASMLVLHGLLSQVRYYNYVHVNQAQLSKMLELSRSAVSESLDFLQKTNIITPVPESQLPPVIKVKPKIERKWYRVSIDLFWKGKASEIDRCPENYRMRYRERDMEEHEVKTLKEAVEKADYFLPEI